MPTEEVQTAWDWPLQKNDGIVIINNDVEKFEVGLECSYFSPKEIEINIINDSVVIHCKHESTTSECSIKREVNRTYKLPKDVDVATLKSHLNNKGTLILTALKK
uniref:SHSP domain-containing protein n=1 Tax=Rhabditophanes sp. KR3021 TaxID=114890 RepID=A0AC35TPX1_9BILA